MSIPANSNSIPDGGTVGQVIKKTDTSVGWDDANNHTHDTSDITSGTLPISMGGTGATSASAALTNLGAAAASHNHSASNITDGTLPVERGGTGANNAASARSNLGAAVSNHTHNISDISGAAPAYSYGTSDLTAGSSALATGKLHFVYE